ncbi:hypothetical protein E2C01_046480 [Portunus trituberculatus]|uniref:Uncharacterized protein n=1 Tax=Portunus trituberculatus TaxID=210409 RepID=A0A5B7G641_PORTR|nr:hypothetical protein [Portunus trituberculatus]
MREEILSSFYHCTSTDAKPQHQLCTQGEKSWCFYNKALARGETPASHTRMLVSFHLADEELEHVKAVYDRLTRDDLLKICLAGLIQNMNEDLHSRIWKICPKHKNASPRMMSFAIATAIANYNAGYGGHSGDSHCRGEGVPQHRDVGKITLAHLTEWHLGTSRRMLDTTFLIVRSLLLQGTRSSVR